MIKIGITGSIASGKTTVAKLLAGKKCSLFNADDEVRSIYKTFIFKKTIQKKFNLNSKKNIKEKIKKIVVKDKKNLKKIEKIVHPFVRKRMKNFVKKNRNKKALIFEIPLLVESKLMKNFNKIIFVNSKKKLRLKRYLKKGKNKKIFNLLDKRQLPPVKKIKFSDYIVNNNGSLKKLKKNVMFIAKKL